MTTRETVALAVVAAAYAALRWHLTGELPLSWAAR